MNVSNGTCALVYYLQRIHHHAVFTEENNGVSLSLFSLSAEHCVLQVNVSCTCAHVYSLQRIHHHAVFTEETNGVLLSLFSSSAEHCVLQVNVSLDPLFLEPTASSHHLPSPPLVTWTTTTQPLIVEPSVLTCVSVICLFVMAVKFYTYTCYCLH